MQWETPEFTEISLAREISGYTNVELSAPNLQEPNTAHSSGK
jgi:coenzyme PQQ precursor peptide PqqA